MLDAADQIIQYFVQKDKKTKNEVYLT